jgi:predicted GIY-YIG superfamily endonuclease
MSGAKMNQTPLSYVLKCNKSITHVLQWEKQLKYFVETWKMLLFEDGEYKWPIFRNCSIDKILRAFM